MDDSQAAIPLSQPHSLQTLTVTYVDPLFLDKLNNLHKTHPTMRTTRGDGNCFYRSMGAEYFAGRKLAMSEQTITRNKIEEKDDEGNEKSELAWSDTLHWKDLLTESGIEFFMPPVRHLLDHPEDAYEYFADEESSNAIVCVLRFLTSGSIRNNASYFSNFIENDENLDSWCRREVDAWGVESSELQILGLCSALRTCCEIAYLDRSAGDQVTFHQFAPIDSDSKGLGKCTLLYRPGHYDILYAK